MRTLPLLFTHYCPSKILLLVWCEKYLCFPTHQPGVLIFNLTHLGSKFWRKNFFLSSLQTSLELHVTSFLKKWPLYNKTITLNLEHTFFLQETSIYNNISNHFSLLDAINWTLSKLKIFPTKETFNFFTAYRTSVIFHSQH